MKYKSYPNSKTTRNRKERKHQRSTIFKENKALNSRRAKKAA